MFEWNQLGTYRINKPLKSLCNDIYRERNFGGWWGKGWRDKKYI